MDTSNLLTKFAADWGSIEARRSSLESKASRVRCDLAGRERRSRGRVL